MAFDTIFWAEKVINLQYKTDPKLEKSLVRLQSILQATTAFISVVACGTTFVCIQHYVNTLPPTTVVKFAQIEHIAPIPTQQIQHEPTIVATEEALPSNDPKYEHSQNNVNPNVKPLESKRTSPAQLRSTVIVQPILTKKQPADSPVIVAEEKPAIQDKSETRRDHEPASQKPIDIAPASKVGIQYINSKSIDLITGRKINIGEKLPNGEILISVDSTTGKIETDRRVIMVTQ